MNRTGIYFSSLGVAVSLLSAQPVSAATFCSGTVDRIYVMANGTVNILGSWRGDYTQVCNVSAAWNGISPDICTIWLAQLEAANTMNKEVILRYEGVECATLPTYSTAPGPTYVMSVASP